MIFYGKDAVQTVREKAQGGEGEIRGRHPFKAEERPQDTRFKMIGEMTLPVGASIGFHVHENDEEIYIIVSGRGIYTDNDKKTYAVTVGDVTLTRRGEGHGLANDGGEPLVFSAVIAD
ncbi:cupin domain-containing protein [Deltaproteobacteria bacterium Smac51]|nr:cupin domain-containing protein [Deltaproteobacteria bacterium Smac51]